MSAGHARALIGVPDPLAAAKRIVAEGLNVRQAEALAHDEGVPERKPQKARGGGKTKDPDTLALEKRVSDALGLAVSVNHRDPGGTVQISYRNLEQLDEVMRRLDEGRSSSPFSDVTQAQCASVIGSLSICDGLLSALRIAVRTSRYECQLSPPLRIRRDRQQRALRDRGGQRRSACACRARRSRADR